VNRTAEAVIDALDFELPPELEAHDPPEASGRSRDDVRLMVTYRHELRLVHARFRELPRFLEPRDLVVVNNSRTLPASIPARRADGTRFDLHLSTPVLCAECPPDATIQSSRSAVWVIELRTTAEDGGRPFRSAFAGETLELPEGSAEIVGPYPAHAEARGARSRQSRLWTAALRLPVPVAVYLERYGSPIRYGHVSRVWPTSYFQNVYAIEPGSAEMPSAGRPFTPQMITALMTRGIDVVPITLHSGVASLEDHEPPLPEFYRVSEATARRVALTKELGGRVIAVGTTVVRALETVTDSASNVRSGEGWTELVISPNHPVRTVDGLLTGWHEPRASHLLMLEAIAGRELLEASYRAALQQRYLWHEFGDLELVLP